MRYLCGVLLTYSCKSNTDNCNEIKKYGNSGIGENEAVYKG